MCIERSRDEFWRKRGRYTNLDGFGLGVEADLELQLLNNGFCDQFPIIFQWGVRVNEGLYDCKRSIQYVSKRIYNDWEGIGDDEFERYPRTKK